MRPRGWLLRVRHARGRKVSRRSSRLAANYACPESIMRDLIRDAFKNCNPNPAQVLDEADPRYVDLTGMGLRGEGQDAVRQMAKWILMSEESSLQPVTGFNGGGKTTE